jgi:hypothetical protein
VPFHQTTTIVIGGKPVDVDAGIAADIAAINARGLSTWVSCQGDDGTAGRAQGKDVAHAFAEIGKLQDSARETYRDSVKSNDSTVAQAKDAATVSVNRFKHREMPANPVSVSN